MKEGGGERRREEERGGESGKEGTIRLVSISLSSQTALNNPR